MKLTPSSTTRRSVLMACSRLGGSPQIPRPVIRIAPNPRRLTVRSPPISTVPAAVADGCVLILPSLSSAGIASLSLTKPGGRPAGQGRVEQGGRGGAGRGGHGGVVVHPRRLPAAVVEQVQ